MESDNFAVQANVLMPSLGNAGFDRDAFTARLWKHLLAIFFRFAIEPLKYSAAFGITCQLDVKDLDPSYPL